MIKNICDCYIVGHIGENGLEQDTLYELTKNGQFIRCNNQNIIQKKD